MVKTAQFCLSVIGIVCCIGCRTYKPGELYHRNPIGSVDAVTFDSIAVSLDKIDQTEMSYVFDAQFQQNHHIAACRLCVVNNSDEDLTVDVLNVENYILPEKAHSRSQLSPMEGIGVGMLMGLVLPFVMVAADTTVGRTERYLSKEGFAISFGLGGLYGIGDAIAVIRENSARKNHILEESSDRYTIGTKRQNCMVLFFDERISEEIPALDTMAYSLSEPLAIPYQFGKLPAITLQNKESGKGVVFPLSYKK